MLGILTIAIGAAHQMTYHRLVVAGVSILPLAGVVVLGIVAWFALFDTAERTKLLGLVLGLLRGKLRYGGVA